MPRFILAVSAGALGLAFVGGSLTAVRAQGIDQAPGDSVLCSYNQSTCTYDGGGYWSGCDSDYPVGSIPTGTAKLICDSYHQSS
jgi:hypothetical protein